MNFSRIALLSLFSAIVGADAFALNAPAKNYDGRWTAETPDEMVELARVRGARELKGNGAMAVASALVLHALRDRATYGLAEKALHDVADNHRDDRTGLSDELELLARFGATDEGTPAGLGADESHGVLTNVAILGPFRDTGGGLDTNFGPEADGKFNDTGADYSWGTVQVGWREVPRAYAGARGVPLDLFVSPRKESCSIVTTTLSIDHAQTIALRLAATGETKLSFDGVEVGRDTDVHRSAFFDRLVVPIAAKSGAHLIAAKVCTGALDDEGRVRLRVTDDGGKPIKVTSSATLINTAPSKAERKPVGNFSTIRKSLDGSTAADDTLAAIIARTLGGMDDLRSPRAPGMLDALTHRANLSADSLAMAAWVAPSGANRSGWLNLALKNSVLVNDAATRAFAERRLIAEHLASHMPDWAIAGYGAAHVSKRDAEWTVLGALINDALNVDPLRVQAMRDLAALVDADPHKAPTSALTALAKLASSFDPTRLASTGGILRQRGFHDAAWVEAEGVHGKKAVSDAAALAFENGLEDATDGIDIANAVAHVSDHPRALELFMKLLAWAPNRPEVYSGYVDETATLLDPKKTNENYNTLTTPLRHLRKLAPGDSRARARLALIEDKFDSDRRREWDERYLVSSDNILARRRGVPAVGTVPDVADRQLYWLRAVTMLDDKRVSQMIHYAREIVIAPRTQDELVEDLPTEGDLTEIVRARVHRKNGTTAFPVEEHNEGARPRIRWPDLLPGDTVEVAIRTWTHRAVGGRGDPPFYFLDYAGAPSTHPLLYNEVIVESTKEHPLYVDVIHGSPDKREDRDVDGTHITRLVWEKPITVNEEPLSPAMSEVLPVIVGSTFHTWTDFRKWYAEAVRGFTDPDAEVLRLASELTKGKMSREAKVDALFNFVADDIRYVNYVSGEFWLPNRPNQLLARREGDCDDKAILLITLLKSIGIDAQEVLVQTRETAQPSVLKAQNAAVPLFDHGIAFLPGPNGGTYLDATSPQSRLGPLPSMDARAVALRMDAGPAEIVELPTSSAEDHGSEVTWTLAMHTDGSADLNGEEHHSGDGAFWLRTYLSQADARLQYVEDNLVGAWLPTVQVDPKIDFSGDLRHGQAIVKYHAKTEGLARAEHGDLVIAIAPSSALASQIAPLVKRTLPVVLPPQWAPSHQQRTIRYVAPEGYTWADLPPGGDEAGGEFGKAHLELLKDPSNPRAVLVKRNLVFDQHFITVEKYPAWRAYIQRVDSLMHRTIRLKRVDGKASNP